MRIVLVPVDGGDCTESAVRKAKFSGFDYLTLII